MCKTSVKLYYCIHMCKTSVKLYHCIRIYKTNVKLYHCISSHSCRKHPVRRGYVRDLSDLRKRGSKGPIA
jgi:hypothetical protein